MKLSRLLYGLALALLLSALARLARDPDPREPALVAPWVQRFDQDGDGQISPTEFARSARYPSDFDLFDADQDGLLSPFELEVLLTRIDPEWVEAPPA